ncbi:pre-peptidase C-terminal domain-containing protein [Cellvibrio mixtus]|uniref:pre-peptidase C-terminal domain-containing protein n=1 Tax=Cellvibrio mixtus TaxID=39650 RepID=UPI0006947DAB|nr:pre-peptidase C-terminal domain-containing protein [Cellvibrio mixtus]
MKNFISKLDQHRHLKKYRFIKYCALLAGFALGLTSLSAVAQIPLANVIKVESGHTNACALTTAGGVKCWGSDAANPGNNTNAERNTAVDIAGLTSGVKDISIGMSHTCVLTETGGVKCWGNNDYGQLGNNTTIQQLAPVDVAGLTSGVATISAGAFHTCAATYTGELKCWGQNTKGQLGDGTTVNQLIPVNVIGLGASAISVSAGHSHTCAITELKGAKCWGWNYSGQLGDNTTVDSLAPVDVYSLSTGVAKIDAGYIHSCALLTNGQIKCWGNNADGRLGNNSTSASSPIPVDLAGTQPLFVDVEAAAYSSCGLTYNSGVMCWGANGSGQLATGTTTRSLVPFPAVGLTSEASSLSVNYVSGCVVKNNGALCWGSNANGTLGDNTTLNRTLPTQVLQPFSPRITNVVAGDSQAIVSFIPPVDDSGRPVNGYTVKPSGPGTDIYAGTTYSHTGPNELSHLVTGLVNGISYTFTVTATNALGTGLPSPASTTVIPRGGSVSSNSQLSSSSQQPGSIFSSSISSIMPSSAHSSSSVAKTSSRSSSSTSSATNNIPCDINPVIFGTTQSGALASTDCRAGARGQNYFVDQYVFNGVAGQQINIQLASTAFNTYLILKNASGTVIASNDNSGNSNNSRIPASSPTYTLPVTGKFTIEVTSFSTFSMGAYTLLVNTPAPVSPCSPVIPITAGIDTYGTLEPADCTKGARGAGYYTDSYSFIGIAGAQIIIHNITPFNSYIYLRNPAGKVIAHNFGGDMLNNSRIPASGTFTLPESGIYVIETTSYYLAITGGYQLHLTSY